METEIDKLEDELEDEFERLNEVYEELALTHSTQLGASRSVIRLLEQVKLQKRDALGAKAEL